MYKGTARPVRPMQVRHLKAGMNVLFELGTSYTLLDITPSASNASYSLTLADNASNAIVTQTRRAATIAAAWYN
jgi:hypothetical protein